MGQRMDLAWPLLAILLAALPPGLGLEGEAGPDIDVATPETDRHYLATPPWVAGKLAWR
eukprot:CAMPEP_0174946122 /NCGR_PEP_ID=MMETSP1355-20121228/83327_1 /TAXON_ID=464990 /ORGANISM="Hemiselmis tepida, Strain CCMP443" /LENGTH=58 /DNA_ID=CAMNT_0016193531 /DNA_START=141 /DNA_END=314 /DNA_ORIENTATION=-